MHPLNGTSFSSGLSVPKPPFGRNQQKNLLPLLERHLPLSGRALRDKPCAPFYAAFWTCNGVLVDVPHSDFRSGHDAISPGWSATLTLELYQALRESFPDALWFISQLRQLSRIEDQVRFLAPE
jgi:hypothetical protein